MYNIMKLKIHTRYKMTLRADFTCRVVNGSRSQVISMIVNVLGSVQDSFDRAYVLILLNKFMANFLSSLV